MTPLETLATLVNLPADVSELETGVSNGVYPVRVITNVPSRKKRLYLLTL